MELESVGIVTTSLDWVRSKIKLGKKIDKVKPHLHHSLTTMLLLSLLLLIDPLQEPSLDRIAAREGAGGAGSLRHQQLGRLGGEVVVGASLLGVVAAQPVGGGR